MQHKLSSEVVPEFVFAGKAIFTIRSEKTANRFTYKTVLPKHQKGSTNPFYYLMVLTGSQNDSSACYSYLGTVSKKWGFKFSDKSRIKDEKALSVVAASWFFKHINHLPEQISVWHEGHCGRCGRLLTVPESIESGFGPECVRLVQEVVI